MEEAYKKLRSAQRAYINIMSDLDRQRRDLAKEISERKQAEQELRLLSGRLLQVQDEERRRIALELHDSTAQALAALMMHLGGLRRSVGKLSQEEGNMLSESLALAKRCMQEIRTLSYLLHPPELDYLGLASALRVYVKGFAERSRIHVDLHVSPELGRLGQEMETALFRIVQESLANIYRHSGSPRAEIRIDIERNQLTVEVEDEGRGMPSSTLEVAKAEPLRLGVGILGMRERLRQLGGQLEVNSSGRGTTVTATIPFSSDRR